MAKFFVMDCHSPLKADHWLLKASEEAVDLRWTEGQPFTPDDDRSGFHPPQEIIEIRTPEDTEVPPREYPELTWVPIPLMTRRLVDALRAAGVDNLQTYDTKLVERRGEKPPPEDHYLAVNLIGLVAAADLKESKLNPDVADRLISADFHSLAIDQASARDLLLFRLAENTSAVIAHESVRASLEKAGITTLTWFDPKNWAG